MLMYPLESAPDEADTVNSTSPGTSHIANQPGSCDFASADMLRCRILDFSITVSPHSTVTVANEMGVLDPVLYTWPIRRPRESVTEVAPQIVPMIVRGDGVPRLSDASLS